MSDRELERELDSYRQRVVQAVVESVDVQPRDRCLEVGCGEGWASRLLACLVTEGLVVGLDASDEMVRAARRESAACENLMCILGEAGDIPWQDRFFSKALCADSFYHFPDPEKALREIHRVLSPGGVLWVVNLLSRENELSRQYFQGNPEQLRSAEEYGHLLRRCGYEEVSHRMIEERDSAGPPSAQDPEAETFRRFRESGALLLTARKPEE